MPYTAEHPDFIDCSPEEPEWTENERIEDDEGPACSVCRDHGFLYAGKEPIPCPKCKPAVRAETRGEAFDA